MIRRIFTVVVALCLVGCSSTFEQKTQQDHQATQLRTQLAADQLFAAQRINPVVKFDEVPRFTGKTVAYQPTQMLPPHIGRVTMRVPGRHTLRSVAAMIERLVDIPVTVSHDALMPASEFAPMASGQGGAGATGGKASTGGTGKTGASAPLSEEAQLTQEAAVAVQKAGGPRGWASDVGVGTEIELNHQGTLVALLDHGEIVPGRGPTIFSNPFVAADVRVGP